MSFEAKRFRHVAVAIPEVRVTRGVRSDLGLQRGSQHLPGTVADDLIEQRPMSGRLVVGHLRIVNYGEHGRTFPTSARTPVLIRATGLSDHPREGAPIYVASPRVIHRPPILLTVKRRL